MVVANSFHFVAVIDQVALALRISVEELAPVAQVLDKFPLAVDVGVEITESAEQRAFGLGITRVELPHLGIKQSRRRRAIGPWRVPWSGASGSNPRRRSASSRETIVQPMASAYSRIQALDGFVLSEGEHALALSSTIGKVSSDNCLCYRKRHIPVFRDPRVCIFCSGDWRSREKWTVRFNQNSISWNHTKEILVLAVQHSTIEREIMTTLDRHRGNNKAGCKIVEADRGPTSFSVIICSNSAPAPRL